MISIALLHSQATSLQISIRTVAQFLFGGVRVCEYTPEASVLCVLFLVMASSYTVNKDFGISTIERHQAPLASMTSNSYLALSIEWLSSTVDKD